MLKWVTCLCCSLGDDDTEVLGGDTEVDAVVVVSTLLVTADGTVVAVEAVTEVVSVVVTSVGIAFVVACLTNVVFPL